MAPKPSEDFIPATESDYLDSPDFIPASESDYLNSSMELPQSPAISSPFPTFKEMLPAGFGSPESQALLDSYTKGKNIAYLFGAAEEPVIDPNAPPDSNLAGFASRVGIQTLGELAKTGGQLSQMGKDLYSTYIDPSYTVEPSSLEAWGNKAIDYAQQKYPFQQSPALETMANMGGYLGAQFAPLVVTGPLSALSKAGTIKRNVDAARLALPALNTVGREYRKNTDAGLPVEEASVKALTQGSVDALLNQSVFNPISRSLGKQALVGGFTSGASELSNATLDQLYGVQDPRSMAERVGVAGVSGALMQPAISLGARGLDYGVEGLRARRAEIANASQNARIDAQLEQVASQLQQAIGGKPIPINVESQPLPLSKGLPEPSIPIDIKVGRELGSEAPLLGLPRSPTDVGPEGASQWTTNVRNIQDLNLPRDIGPEGVNQFLRGQEAIAQPGPDVQSPILDEFGQPIQREFAPRDLTLSEPPKPESTIIQPENISGGPRQEYPKVVQKIINKYNSGMKDPQRGAINPFPFRKKNLGFGGTVDKVDSFIEDPNDPSTFIKDLPKTFSPENIDQTIGNITERSSRMDSWLRGESENIFKDAPALKGAIAEGRKIWTFPETLARKFPETFDKFFTAGLNRFENQAAILYDGGQTLKPMNALSVEEMGPVSHYFEAVEKLGGRKELLDPQIMTEAGLTPPQVEAARSMVEFYDNALDVHKEMLQARVADLPEVDQPAALQKIDEDIEALRSQFYFPKRRWGDHLLNVTDETGRTVASYWFYADKGGTPPKEVKSLIADLKQKGFDDNNLSIAEAGKVFKFQGKEVALDVLAKLASKNERFYAKLLEGRTFDGAFSSLDDALDSANLSMKEAADLRSSNAEWKKNLSSRLVPEGTMSLLARSMDVPGYSLDLRRATNEYLNTLSHNYAQSIANKEFADAFKTLDPRAHKEAAVKEYVKEYRDYVLGPSTDAAEVKKFLAIFNLGGSPRFALMNALQPTMSTLSELVGQEKSFVGGLNRFAKGYAQLIHNKIAPEDFARRNPELANALKEATRRGVISNDVLHLYTGLAKRVGESKDLPISDILMWAANTTEGINRAHAFIVDFSKTNDFKSASRFTVKTQFGSNKADRPPVLRGGAGTVLMFKPFAGKMIRLMRDSLGEKNLKKFIAYQAAFGLVGGVRAIPYVTPFLVAAKAMGMSPGSVLNEVIESSGLEDLFGSRPTTDEEGRKVPSKLNQAIQYGVPHAAGLATLTGAASIAPTPTGDDPLASAIQFFGGPIADMLVKRPMGIYDAVNNKDWGRALENVLPPAAADLVKVNRAMTQYRNPLGEIERKGFVSPSGVTYLKNPSGWDLARKAVGLTPPSLSLGYDRQTKLREIAKEGADKKNIYNRIANAYWEGNKAEAQRLYEEAKRDKVILMDTPRQKAAVNKALEDALLEYASPDIADIARVPSRNRQKALEYLYGKQK